MIKNPGKFIEDLLTSLINAFGGQAMDYEETRKRLLLAVAALAGIPIISVFAVYNWRDGLHLHAILSFGTVAGLAACLFAVRRMDKGINVYRAAVLIPTVLFLQALWIGGVDGSMILWMYILPLAMFFALGRGEGLVWALAALALSALILEDPGAHLGSYHYGQSMKSRFYISFLLVSIMAYVFELSRLWWQQEMEQEHMRLLEEKAFLNSTIRQRQAAEDALRESQKLYALLSENMKDVIWTADCHMRMTFVSPGVEDLRGYTPEEAMAQAMDQVFTLESHEAAQRMFRRALEGKSTESVSMELEMRRRDGGSVWTETIASLFLDAQGEPAGFIGVSRDITDRRKAEEALRRNEERFREFVENAPVGMFTVDLHGNFTYGNKKIFQMTGHQGKDWIGRQFFSMVHPDDLPKIIRAMEDAASSVRITPHLHVRIKNAAGEAMWLVVTSEMLWATDDNGVRKPSGFQCFVEDVTERQKSEMEKQRLERQLRQAHKMEAIGTLAGGIAHDFNNILSPIIGYTEMAREALPPEDPAARDLNEVLRAAARAKDLVRQILTFSRQAEEKQKPVDLYFIVMDVLKLIRATLPATIQVRRHLSRRAGAVMADPTQMHQVFMNLCTNAYQAMRDSGGVLEIALRNRFLGPEDLTPGSPLKSGNYAWISVSDTGMGMGPEIMERIFEPYFTTKPVGEGSGMGLAVAHAIVAKHGGEIRVSSQVGKGTAFEIFLPALEEAPVEAEHTLPQALEQGHERILLVEDEETILNMTTRMLEKLGYQVFPFEKPQEALAAFKQASHAFDLVVTDMTMPRMTGAELSQRLLEIRPGMPIILCTGFSEKISDKKARTDGILEYLMKPVSMAQLSASVRKALDSR